MFKEHIHVHDEAIVNGQLVQGEKAGVIGEVTVEYQSKRSGKTVFTKNIYHNDLLTTGSVYMSEKINNMRSTFQTLALDVELGAHTQEELLIDHTTIPMEKICGLMIGIGGAGDVYSTVYKVDRSKRSVPTPIPYRVVPVLEDLDEEMRKKYFLRVVRGEYVYYYGKKPDNDPTIFVEYEDGTVVPVDVDTTVNTKFIRVYTQYRFHIEQADVREYFKLTQGSTLRSLINCFGLVTGYPQVAEDSTYEDFYNVRGMTDLHMENHELKDSESTIGITYKLYIV